MQQRSLDVVVRSVRYCPWLLALAICWGCAKSGELPTAPVTGKVTYKGKPVPNGTVMFVPEKGPAATGEIGTDGTYTLTTYSKNDGAVLGKHKIAVTALADMSGRMPEDRNPLPPPIVPEKYLDQDKSGLTREIKEGPNTVNLELKD